MGSPRWFIEAVKRLVPAAPSAAPLTRLPLIGPLVDKALFEHDDVMILPRDRAIQVNRTIDMPTQQVLPSTVVEHFIEQSAHHWIMNTCVCREMGRCEDYPADLGCLFLGEATLDINASLGRHVSSAEARDHVQRARELGLVHLIGRSKFDAVWLDVGPGHKLMTICHCCPCCCLTRLAPRVDASIGAKITATPGVTVDVDVDRCVGCGSCTDELCFVDAIHLAGGKARITHDCRGCGRCVDVCRRDAIHLRVDGPDYVDRSIARLESAVDVG